MLFNCVNSFYQHCNSELFDIFIADTGSTNEEKNDIKNTKTFTEDYDNIS